MSGDTRWTTFQSVIETCLAEGFAPLRSVDPGKGSAVREAARRLNLPPSTLIDWVTRQERIRAEGREHWVPDWSIFSAAHSAAEYAGAKRNYVPDAPGRVVADVNYLAEEQPADPLIVRRLRDELAATKAALKAAERDAALAQDVRSGLRLDEPIAPRFNERDTNTFQHGRQAVILHISDLHAGEVISSAEILGSNKYDLKTFRDRTDRLFSSAAKLCTNHWPRDDRPPDEIVICLGGDLVSGSIHPELAETNEGTDYQIFREVAERIAGGIEHLRETVGLPCRIYSVPGNHGRQVLKPQHKRQGLQSWDTLVADFAESALNQDQGIEWFRSEGTDCYFDVVGFPILLTHGHAMGSGGGMGFIGPAAPIIRGHQKVSHTELRQRRPVHLILSGHYHTTIKTPWGWSNGSMVGYNEYVRSMRGEPEPAQQSMFVMHERKGLIRWQPIYLGHPSEGSLYQGFAPFNEGVGHVAANENETANAKLKELLSDVWDGTPLRHRG